MNRFSFPLLAAFWLLLPGRAAAQFQDDAKPPQADAKAAPGKAVADDGKDTRLTLDDIRAMREKRIAPAQVLDHVAEQGRAFEVTDEVAGEFKRLGFGAAQIDAIKQSSHDRLLPGRWLTIPEKNRDYILKVMTQIAAKSGADIEPFATKHVTLWVTKGAQSKYLPDLQKLETFFHAKCAEPIRSGLDKRSTHVFLLKDHAEYQAWCRAMFDSPHGKRLDEMGGGGTGAFYREQIPQWRGYSAWDCFATSREEIYNTRRALVAGVADMYFAQLAPYKRSERANERGPLPTGFMNVAETVVFGKPGYMLSSVVYGVGSRQPQYGKVPWNLLVKQRMTARKATPVDELLRMSASAMSEPHYAEGWTLVGLLSKQPEKFGKLLLELRTSSSEMAAIEKIYGWDEKNLTQEWRKYVVAEGSKAAAKLH